MSLPDLNTSDHAPQDDLRGYLIAWSAMFASIVALVLASIALASRLGLPHPSQKLIGMALAVSWLLLNGPACLVRQAFVHRWQSYLLGNLGVVVVGTLGIVIVVGWTIGQWAAIPLALCGVLTFVMQGWHLLRLGRWWLTALLVPAALFTGVALAGSVWGQYYQTPVFEEGLARNQGHLDELFHIAVSNMIRTYGVPSTGLDGVPYLPYHFGSHFALAALAELLGTTGLKSYSLVYPIVFPPLFLFTLQTAGLQLFESLHANSRWLSFRATFLMWFVPMTIIAGVIPLSVASNVGVSSTDIVSESWCIALILLFCLIGAIGPYLKFPESIVVPPLERVIAAALFPVMVMLLTLCKASVGFAVIVVGSYLAVRSPLIRRNRFSIGVFVVAVILGVYAIKITKTPTPDGLTIRPFDFLQTYVPRTSWAWYFLVNYSWLAALTYSTLRCRVTESWKGFRTSVLTNRLLEVEIAIVSALAGFVPGMLLRIGGGSASYFLDIQRWVSALFLIPIGIECHRILNKRLRHSANWSAAQTCLQLFGGTAVIVSLATMVLNSIQSLGTAAGLVMIGRGIKNPSVSQTAVSWIRQRRIDEIPPETQKADLVALLLWLEQLPASEKRRTVLYIPKSNRTYWDFFEDSRLRKSTPFIGPALAGMALIDGLPDPDSEVSWSYYGFDLYRLPSQPQPRLPALENRVRVLAAAERAGMARVIAIEAENQEFSLKEWVQPGVPHLTGDSWRAD